MIPLGLTAAELATFHRTLAGPHSFTVSCALLTLSGDHVATIGTRLLSGQVDVDVSQDVTRSCTATFLDPSHSLQLDSDSPDDGALDAARMLRIRYSVRVPDLGRRVSVPVFTGPIVDVERDGDTVTVQALGKEDLALNTVWRPITLKKGLQTDDAIKTLLSTRCGESDFDFPAATTKRLAKSVSLGRLALPWAYARRFASSINRQVYYDGHGTCRLRRLPGTPVFTFLSGRPTGSNITSPVKVHHDFTQLENAVWVRGGKPKGKKVPVSVFVTAPAGHVRSPARLGRNGVPRYIVREVQNDHVRSRTAATTLARQTLDDLLVEDADVTFTSYPIPHLDPMDLVRVTTDDFSSNVRLRRFSLPLTADGQMTVGYLQRVPRKRGRR